MIEVAETIPFIALTDWNHEKLYSLKGDIVSAGIKAITGLGMPVFEKRRFQHGAAPKSLLLNHFPKQPSEYRRAFNALYD